MVEPRLVQGFAHRRVAMGEVEIALAGLQRPAEPQDGANCAKAGEIEVREVDRYGTYRVMKLLLDGESQLLSIRRFHPPLGTRDQARPVNSELGPHCVKLPFISTGVETAIQSMVSTVNWSLVKTQTSEAIFIARRARTSGSGSYSERARAAASA